MRRSIWTVAMFGVVFAAGCSQQAPTRPLRPEAFGRRPVEGAGTPQPIDQPGALQYGKESEAEPNGADRPNEISRTVRESIRLPRGEGARGVDTQPSDTQPSDVQVAETQPAANGISTADGAETVEGPGPSLSGNPGTHRTDPSGQYQLLGSVLATVNGTPIFADKVLAGLERPLAAEAKNLKPAQFKGIARQLIENELTSYIRNELEFAAAQKSVAKGDEQMADMATSQWRQRKITEAGGSLELAKRKAAEDGFDFDEQVKEQYKLELTRIYYQRRVWPLVYVSQDDIRHYYNDNLDKEFTEHGAARFRLIKIDPRQLRGGRMEAIATLEDLKKQLVAGASFEKLAASNYNNDPGLRATGGDVGMVQQGAFKVEEVQRAVWKLQPGQVTDPPVETADAFYLARLEEIKRGSVQSFENPEVQRRIKEKLQARQFSTLRNRRLEQLHQEFAVVRDPQMTNLALEMAMQRYPTWTRWGK